MGAGPEGLGLDLHPGGSKSCRRPGGAEGWWGCIRGRPVGSELLSIPAGSRGRPAAPHEPKPHEDGAVAAPPCPQDLRGCV